MEWESVLFSSWPRGLSKGEQFRQILDIRGTAYCAGGNDGELSEIQGVSAVEIPSFEEVSSDRIKYSEAFRLQSLEMNPFCAGTIFQRHGNRRLVCNPPAFPLAEHEMDAIYALPFIKAPHPAYKEKIPAYEQIKASITTHRGCFGGCAFCAITYHQGKIIQSRSEKSILLEIDKLTGFSWFKGSVSDVGGPTANMYGLSCGNSSATGCRKTGCLYPAPCKHLRYSGKKGRLCSAVRVQCAG